MKLYKHGTIKETWVKNDFYNLYVTESGNPKGIPVMSLHGGPGIPMGDSFRKIWNPKKFRVFTFHQRGCGKSTPRNCLKKNKSNDMIRDIEKIRKYINWWLELKDNNERIIIPVTWNWTYESPKAKLKVIKNNYEK